MIVFCFKLFIEYPLLIYQHLDKEQQKRPEKAKKLTFE